MIDLTKITITKEVNDKYNIINNSFVDKDKIEIHNEFETEIGDVKQTDFLPQIKVKRWDNECNFSVRLIDDDFSLPVVITDKEKIMYKILFSFTIKLSMQSLQRGRKARREKIYC